MQPSSSATSVSRLKLVIEITNKGSATCELVRHLAPVTAREIIKSLPVQDRIHRFSDKFVYIETGLVIGAEKQTTKFKRGDLAFLTSNASLCIFMKDAAVQPMNPLGIITSNLEVIESSKTGDVMLVKKSSATTTTTI
jgi:uncharacterized protein